MCNDIITQSNNLANIFESIIMLQQRGSICDGDSTCTKPFLGPTINPLCLNTRPINIYSCCNNTLWTMPYTLNGVEGTSNIFRIESIDDNTVTCRVLALNTVEKATPTYLSTQDYFTIKLSCIGAIKCLGDTFVTLT